MSVNIHQKAAELVAHLLNEVLLPPEGSEISKSFGKTFSALPQNVQDQIHEIYHRWVANPGSLDFQRKFDNYYAVKLLGGHRAVCAFTNHVIWLFTGRHTVYDTYVDGLRGKGPYTDPQPPPASKIRASPSQK